MIILVTSDRWEFREDVSKLFKDKKEASEAYREYPQLTIIECDRLPVCPMGWTWDGSKWNMPTSEGKVYDLQSSRLYYHDDYRVILHQRTVDDVLEAQRKIRAGDTSIDWQAWLDVLDAYNKAVSDTKFQDTYPDKVTYPKYPTKPTPQS